MRKFFFLVVLMGLIMTSQAQEERPLFFVHYMPWYQAPNISGSWGWHWTMNHFNPETLNENGRPEVASHYMPITGPYDSADPVILEYQVLLMKMSGMDGVIADWYGIEDFRDYAAINRATVALFDYTQKAGLQFILCYEDRTIDAMLDEGYLTTENAVARGQEDMQFANETFMSHESYARFNGQPLMFTFGPLYFRDPRQWEEMFTGIEPAPALVTLDNRMATGALGSYPWPPMSYAGGLELFLPVLEGYLENFFRSTRRNDYHVGIAVPRFHDIYEQAGVQSSYGYLDDQDGAVFRRTFEMSLEVSPDLIQIVTWNDYGEGTTIEPTDEYGYQYLEIVQEQRQALSSDFSYTSEDLTVAFDLYTARRAHEGDEAVNAELDKAFDAIINGDIQGARDIIAAQG
jgi:hypothetical protein